MLSKTQIVSKTAQLKLMTTYQKTKNLSAKLQRSFETKSFVSTCKNSPER